ncbi:hypothetical protein COCOBI_19-1020 [Coccomyxa sp. Obi]|nr:hypothetical protein COCOBI_19-0900 [Coccomyxa sp. Obi]BDA51546.1 hypothetical protein COCOBI_19-1020 [Coccomyxa sp. Obi]
MDSCASSPSPTAQRTFRWHQRAENSSRVSFGSRPHSQSLSTPDVVLTLTVASRQSPKMAFLQEDRSLAATTPADSAAPVWCRARWINRTNHQLYRTLHAPEEDLIPSDALQPAGHSTPPREEVKWEDPRGNAEALQLKAGATTQAGVGNCYKQLEFEKVSDEHSYEVAEEYLKKKHNGGDQDASLLESAIKSVELRNGKSQFKRSQSDRPTTGGRGRGGTGQYGMSRFNWSQAAMQMPAQMPMQMPVQQPVSAMPYGYTPQYFDSACGATSTKPAESPATKPAPKYVKGRLKAKLAFWQLFCKSTVVLSWISSGYEIPWALGVTPPPLSFPNAAGALQREAFVSAEIADLLARGSIMQTHLPPAVISPLNVVERREKLRLILDLVYVNRFIDQTGLKFKQAPLGLKQFVVQQSFQLCSALLEHRPKLYFSTSVSFCLSTVYNMAPAEGAPDEPGIDNPEQPPSGTNSELAELKRMFMDSQMESREREKRMCAALQSRNTLTEAGKLARVPPGTCYSSALVVRNCQLQKSDQ